MGPVGRPKPPCFRGTMARPVCPGLGSHAAPPAMSLPGKETPWVAGLLPLSGTEVLCVAVLLRSGVCRQPGQARAGEK